MKRHRSAASSLQALAAALAVGAVACRLAFHAIGSHVDTHGLLRESFFLLPISVLLLLASGLALIAACALHRRSS